MRFGGSLVCLLAASMARPGAAQEPGPAPTPPSFAEVVTSNDTAEPAIPPIDALAWQVGQKSIHLAK
jgi:hypothetical protein